MRTYLMQQARHYVMFGMIILCGLTAWSAPAQLELPEESDEALLERAFNTLDLLWELQWFRSDDYADAHNLFIMARQATADLELFPLAMPKEFSTVCVKYQLFQRQLVIMDGCGTMSAVDTFSARTVWETAQQLLAEYYLENFQQRALDVFDDLKQVVQKEPDSALADFVPKLQEILTYAELLTEEPSHINVRRIIETQSALNDAEILVHLESRIRETLKNDVSFGSGQYSIEDFAEQGKTAIQHFVQRLLEIKRNYPLQYPEQALSIKIKTVGYTDEVPIRSPHLIGELLQDIDAESLPVNPVERQSFLNRRLSEFRAATVNQYAQEQLQQAESGLDGLEILPEIVGKGEELPNKGVVSPPYLKRDPRRRICKISVIFSRKPPPTLFKITLQP